MTFKEYQEAAKKTAIYPDEVKGLYPLLGLYGEAAETIEKARGQVSLTGHRDLEIEGEAFERMSEVNIAIASLISHGKNMELIKKHYRKNGLGFQGSYKISSTPEEKEELKKELGDIMWYMAAICSDFDISLEEVAEMNIAKLQSRKERGVIEGSGDNR